MNQKEGARWELRLGVFLVVVLLGLIMGLLTCVFFLGYFSGRQVGHDAALSASLSNTIKLPIGESDQGDRVDEEASKKVASEVYARLNDNSNDSARAQDAQNQAEMPHLGAIDSTIVSPVDQVQGAGAVAGEAPAQAVVSVVASPESTALPSREQLLKQVIALEDKAPEAPVGLPAGEPVVAVNSPVAEPTPIPSVSEIPTVVPTAKPKETNTPKPTATPKPAKTAKAEQSGTNIPKGWFAQIAAPRKKEDAAELSRQLRKSGFGVIVEVAQVRGEQYYRVLAGPEASKGQAEKLIEQLKREPYILTQPFLRQIK